MVYDHPQFPKALKDEMYAWLREHAADERKPTDTEEQWLYKSRKKAIGPFKQRVWDLPAGVRDAISRSLEERFTFLLKQLKVENTAATIGRFVKAPDLPFDKDREIVAAGGQITAAERKAEGLAD
jgi:hypothetical protein